jgi:uncharacterized protein YndB with AHSA1/START domain/catechol 2,3-dioxygenase-like lactoylglutathione lyase family enzyme
VSREIVLTREFAAPRARVFAAHTEPHLLRRWFGPHGWRLTVCEVDLRAGGAWRYVMHGPDGAEMVLTGTYLEVDAPDRLVMTERNTYCDARAEYESVITLDFAGDTTLTHTARFPTEAIRDAVLASGMARGIGEGFDRLEETLEHTVDWKIELVPVPVTDVDRAKDFYANKMGFAVDVDHAQGDAFRIVQLTPPGSGCSIAVGIGICDMKPGDLIGVQLVVDDIQAAHRQLTENGAEPSNIYHFEDGRQVDGPGDRWNSFLSLSDPDGNRWTVQERPADEG